MLNLTAQVKFHSSGRVISASTDGLVAVHDVSKSFDDDDCFEAALNLGTSVEELGLYGNASLERMWLRTGTESLHLWEWMKAAQEEPEGAVAGSMAFADFIEARNVAAQAAAMTEAATMFEQVRQPDVHGAVCSSLDFV